MFGGIHLLKYNNLPNHKELKDINNISYLLELLNRRKNKMEIYELKVSSKSNPSSIAGMIAAMIKEETKRLELVGIGAGAVNQAVKAIAVARGFLAPQGVDLICIPAFHNVNIDGDCRTCIKLIVEVK